MCVYLDTNFFIGLVEGDAAQRDAAHRVVENAVGGRATLVTSELTLGEVLVKPYRLAAVDPQASAALLDVYGDVVSEPFVHALIPIDRDILQGAAQRRAARPALQFLDAIHLATAEAARGTILLSSDQRILTAEQQGLERIEVSADGLSAFAERLA